MNFSELENPPKKIRKRQQTSLGQYQEGHSRRILSLSLSLCDEPFGDRRHCLQNGLLGSNIRRLAKRENCRDFVDVSRANLQVPNGLWIPRELVASRIPRDCGATITRDESAILVKDHETLDASNLAPLTQLVLALPVAVVQGQSRLLTKKLLECLTACVSSRGDRTQDTSSAASHEHRRDTFCVLWRVHGSPGTSKR